jgi:hypothetical protein
VRIRWYGLVVALLAGCARPPALPRSPELGHEGALFRYRDPAAHVVQISGSWMENFFLRGVEWTRNTRVGRMERAEDGVWELRVPLGPGRYEYLFLVDGRFWELDPANPERAPDGSGGFVSLFVVP